MNIVVIVLMVVGLIFFLGGAVGVLRFPDAYSRLHPAGKSDTLASLLMMLGLAVYNLGAFSLGEILTSAKIIMILVLVHMASPTATHAIVDAGLRGGLKPWTKKEEGE